MAEQQIQSAPLVEKLAFCQQNQEYLNEWENQRVSEWLSYATGGGFLSRKCQSIVEKMLGDIEQKRKPLSKELKEIIDLALARPRALHQQEVQFVEGLADFVEGQIKLSVQQRSWLHKIEHRIHKSGF